MPTFLKIVDLHGDLQYINERWIVSIRPINRKNFRESGAELKVSDGSTLKSFFTQPGETTNPVVAFLGIEEP